VIMMTMMMFKLTPSWRSDRQLLWLSCIARSFLPDTLLNFLSLLIFTCSYASIQLLDDAPTHVTPLGHKVCPHQHLN